MIVIDKNFETGMETACRNLCHDGLKIKFQNLSDQETKNIEVTPTTGIGKAIQIFQKILEKAKHALYRGEIYCKCPKGNFGLQHFFRI